MEELNCVICKNNTYERVILFTLSTLNKCRYILEIRKKFNLKFHDVSLPFEVNVTEGYHSKCYSYFTALKRIFKEKYSTSVTAEQPSAIPEEPSTSSETPTLVESHLYVVQSDEADYSLLSNSPLEEKSFVKVEIFEEEVGVGNVDESFTLSTDETDVCFFCKKLRKTVRGRIQKLSSSKSETWLQTLKGKATEANDSEMLGKIESGVKNIIYHNYCKMSYFSQCRHVSIQQKEPTVWHDKRRYHASAFDQLCQYISHNVVNKKKCYFLNFMKSLYIEYLHEKYEDIEEEDHPNYFSTQHLKRKILDAFKGEVQIITIQKKKVILPFGCTILNNADSTDKNCKTSYGDLLMELKTTENETDEESDTMREEPEFNINYCTNNADRSGNDDDKNINV